MTNTAIQRHNGASVLEDVVIKGNLAELDPADRVTYYRVVCESVGLNPYTRPFQYITLSGKLTLYATKDATEQLRKRDKISIKLVGREMHTDVGAYIVTAQASDPDGRTDEATGAVSIANLKGENLANALMKAETKAKRRVTLSICGLGMLDATEVEAVPGADLTDVDIDTGEIRHTAPQPDSPAGHSQQGPSPFPRVIRGLADQAGLTPSQLDELAASLIHRSVDSLAEPGAEKAGNQMIAALRDRVAGSVQGQQPLANPDEEPF